jgi:glucokinase
MYTIAIDMGGTRIKLGLVKDGILVDLENIKAFSDIGLEPRLPVIAETIISLCKKNNITVKDCIGIGISSPGVNENNLKIASMNEKYNDAVNLDLPKWADETFALPLFIENDARMAAIGEWKYGAGRGFDNIVMMTIGTGLGTCPIVDGKLLRGAHGIAGILGGHFTVNYRGAKCTCPNIGCAEIEASTVSLNKLAHEHKDFKDSKLSKFDKIEYAEVFKFAKEGDKCASDLLEHSLNIWSITVQNLVHAYDPELIILGGGIMASGDVIIPRIQEYIENHSWNPWGKPKVVAAQHGNSAALLACEWLLKEKIL